MAIIVLFAMIYFFQHIEDFMPNDEGKVISQTNKYFDEQEKDNPLDYIENATLRREPTEEEKKLFQTTAITTIFDQNVQENVDEHTTIAGDILVKNTEQYIIPQTKYGDIFYQQTEYSNKDKSYPYQLIVFFTQDQKKIYFEKRSNGIKKPTSFIKTSSIDQESLIHLLQEWIPSLGLNLTYFSPSIILEEDGNYTLTDEKQSLEIIYDTLTEKVIKFNLGF